MRFTSFFIERPAATIALIIATVALGARALVGLGYSDDPGLGRPAIGITVRYPGALPANVEREVVRPIERRVAGTKGIQSVEATARDGFGRVVIYFDSARQLEQAFQPIHDAVLAGRVDLPIGTDEPAIARVDRNVALPVALLPSTPGALSETLGQLAQALGAGFVIALILVLCFASSWRSTLIVATAVVVSALGTIAAFGVLGLDLTPMSLVALALAFGLMIDDPIVIRESIVRHVERGMDSREAALQGTSAMAGGVLAGSLAGIAVFGPIANAGGPAGRRLAAIGFTILVAVVVSSIVSLIVVPALSARLSNAGRDRRPVIAPLRRLDCWFDGLTDHYHDLLAWTLDHRPFIAGLSVASLAVVIAIQVASGKTTLLPTDRRVSSADSAAVGESKPIQLELRGPDSRTLFGVAQRIAEDVGHVPGTADIDLSIKPRTDSEGLAQIDHIDGARVIRVRANVSRRALADVVADIDARLGTIPLPPGYRVVQKGEIANRADVFRHIVTALGIGLALVYLLLAVRLRSLIEPLAILLAIPISFAGVLTALLVSGSSLDLLSLVATGFVVALSVRHAILVVRLAKTRRSHGVSIRVSLIEAGQARLRPIMVTAVAVVGALIPIALVGGNGSASYLSLGAAVIGGTLASTAVTLVLVPIFFAVIDDARERVGAWKLLRSQAPYTASD